MLTRHRHFPQNSNSEECPFSAISQYIGGLGTGSTINRTVWTNAHERLLTAGSSDPNSGAALAAKLGTHPTDYAGAARRDSVSPA